MLLTSWLGFEFGVSHRTPPGRHPAHRRATSRRELRPNLERLEDLTLLTSYTAATVSDLIADISTSNQQGGTNTIALVAGNSFLLTAVDNTTGGTTGLPVIAAHDNLTIVGNGDAIARSTVTGTPAFRLLDVAAGASLTLQNLTLQGGLASARESRRRAGPSTARARWTSTAWPCRTTKPSGVQAPMPAEATAATEATAWGAGYMLGAAPSR